MLNLLRLGNYATFLVKNYCRGADLILLWLILKYTSKRALLGNLLGIELYKYMVICHECFMWDHRWLFVTDQVTPPACQTWLHYYFCSLICCCRLIDSCSNHYDATSLIVWRNFHTIKLFNLTVLLLFLNIVHMNLFVPQKGF